jgi:hypothetical protein
MAKKRIYHPINLNKYSGAHPIVLKSSWEEEFARKYCDLNPSCLEWAYEPWKIPYRDPTADPIRYPKGKQTIYIPDFLISFQTPEGRIRTSLIEIKPKHESLNEFARSVADQRQVAKNYAKWRAAIAWCERRANVEFVILTEAELFPDPPKPQRKRRRSTLVRKPARRRVKKS